MNVQTLVRQSNEFLSRLGDVAAKKQQRLSYSDILGGSLVVADKEGRYAVYSSAWVLMHLQHAHQLNETLEVGDDYTEVYAGKKDKYGETMLGIITGSIYAYNKTFQNDANLRHLERAAFATVVGGEHGLPAMNVVCADLNGDVRTTVLQANEMLLLVNTPEVSWKLTDAGYLVPETETPLEQKASMLRGVVSSSMALMFDQSDEFETWYASTRNLAAQPTPTQLEAKEKPAPKKAKKVVRANKAAK